MAKILVIDDERSIRFTLQHLLQQEGHIVQADEDAENARQTLAAERFDIVICDINLPGLQGTDLMRLLQGSAPETAVILITGSPKMETIIDGIRGGAVDYLIKPVSKENLLQAVNGAAQRTAVSAFNRRLEHENRYFQHALYEIENNRKKDELAITGKLIGMDRAREQLQAQRIRQEFSSLLRSLPQSCRARTEQIAKANTALLFLLSPEEIPQGSALPGVLFRRIKDPSNCLAEFSPEDTGRVRFAALIRCLFLLEISLQRHSLTADLSVCDEGMELIFEQLTAGRLQQLPEYRVITAAAAASEITATLLNRGETAVLQFTLPQKPQGAEDV